jgi:hypothetical protein
VLPAPDCKIKERISIARGNVILVDHGRTIDAPERLGQVPVKATVGECECGAVETSRTADKFQPKLKEAPLTFSQPLAGPLHASGMLIQDPRLALPQITKLVGLPGMCPEESKPQDASQPRLVGHIDSADPLYQWSPQRDLLSSRSDERHFVAEMDNDGRCHLLFGDGESGQKPDACAIFEATYRVGNGTAGNVGADAITHLVLRSTLSAALTPRNPLPARAGSRPNRWRR